MRLFSPKFPRPIHVGAGCGLVLGGCFQSFAPQDHAAASQSAGSSGTFETTSFISGETGGMTGYETSSTWTSTHSTTSDPQETTSVATSSVSSTTSETTSVETTTSETTGMPEGTCDPQLKTIFRDFKSDHLDFESYCCGLSSGLVKSNLGPDEKPAFNKVGVPQMLTSAETFYEWYHDVEDVNLLAEIWLPLQEVSPGIFAYKNETLFPLDGMLFGNEGNQHNYHFTAEAKFAFVYQGGEALIFEGSHALWIFVDHKLVMDLGGVHGVTKQVMDFDTLGLTPNAIYELHIFFAQQHSVQSAFDLSMNFCPLS